MKTKAIIKTKKNAVPVHRSKGSAAVVSLRNDINRLFDEFLGDFGTSPLQLMDDRVADFTPQVDVSETDKEVRVTVELPGLDEKDVEVSVDENILTIKGEKKDEQEKKTAHSYYLERSFGSFLRMIPLPNQVKTEKMEAVFKKGVLQIVLPKNQSERAKSRKIEVNAA